MKNFHAAHKTVRDLLDSNFFYKIPKYQRPYAWSKDNAQELWDDLMSGNDLFFGSFVFNVENKDSKGFVEIVDGQQRITTLNILLASIRNKLKEIDENDQALKIQQKISFVSDLDNQDRPRLESNEVIRILFEESIQKYDWNGIFPRLNSRQDKVGRQVKEVFEFFRDRLGEFFDEENLVSNNDVVGGVRKILKSIYESKIIWIEVETDEDAYTIFETMNARGADLTAADLLKNYIFSKLHESKEYMDEISSEWKLIENNVSNVPKLNISKFIRYYWIARHKFVTEKNLYREIKQSRIEPKDLLTELQSSSEWFSLLGNGSHEDWEERLTDTKLKCNEIYNSLLALRLFGTTQCFVLFLCLLSNLDRIKFNFSYIFKDIENFHFLYSAISKQPGNKVEKLYANSAKCINEILLNEKEEKNISEKIQSELSRLKSLLVLPAFETFEEGFMELSYEDKPLINYIFDRFNKKLDHEYATKTKIFMNKDYNIDHILPKNPVNWGLKNEETEDYVDKLGNLIIIDRRINGWMQDDVFKEKIEKLKASSLPLIKDYVKKYGKFEWNKDKIKDRQKEMAEIAFTQVWKE
ncbi:MAG: DUF262 domain-containing HNH endonuclease family protein [Candidatus Paceibacterota bacterium]|jgi:hypothetical protein